MGTYVLQTHVFFESPEASLKVKSLQKLFITLCLCALAIFVASVTERSAQAEYRWSPSGSTRKGSTTWAIEFAGRYQVHYNRQSVLSTPPEALMGELQLQLWYRKQIGLYLLYSKSITGDESGTLGGGLKLPFLNFTSYSGGGVTFMIVADYIQFTYPPPAIPGVYPTSGSVFRYGGAMSFSFGGSGIFIDTTMMVTNINNNFMIAPLIGIGFHF